MILPEDADFHPHDPSDTTWTETIGFWFAVPDAALFGNIYLLARPEVGATICSINTVRGHRAHPFEVDFTDPRVHVPCPASMSDFQLTNGLTVKVEDAPTGYRFDYEAEAGSCALSLTLSGSMPAWDPHDPSENPLAPDDDRADLGLGDVWSHGHLDFVGRVHGDLTVRGRRYSVESMGAMDRSWGPRRELGLSAVSYMHVPFDEHFGLHLVMTVELDHDGVRYPSLRFGYVYDHGSVVGLVDATMETVHRDMVPASTRIVATDATRRRFDVRGEAIASAPWYTFSPAYAAFQALMRYQCDDRVGHGLVSEVWGIEYLAKRTSALESAG